MTLTADTLEARNRRETVRNAMIDEIRRMPRPPPALAALLKAYDAATEAFREVVR